MKLKTIKLTDCWDTIDGPSRYRVESLTDSVDYKTGEFLEKKEVESLCEAASWKVTIIHRT